jgi:2-oxoglutarate dehydrogenase E1 component
MAQSLLEQFEETSYLSASSAEYIEDLYERFLRQDNTVPKVWHDYFISLGGVHDASHAHIREKVRQCAVQPGGVSQGGAVQAQVQAWIAAYRDWGHLGACLDPLGLGPCDQAHLARARFSLQGVDAQAQFVAPGLFAQPVTLDQLEARLQQIYLGSIGFEIMHVVEPDVRAWLIEQAEAYAGFQLSSQVQGTVLAHLEQAQGMEQYLGRQFVGQKRFSLEGGESLIVALEALLAETERSEVNQMMIGMAHRGRLNVMVNVLGMSMQELLDQFAGVHALGKTSGDVKYHLGYTSRRQVGAKTVKVQLGFNPSHLEAIGAVLMGIARAHADHQDSACAGVLPIIIHGDSAVIGQGVVSESVNMGGVAAHHVGGSVRIIVNNEIGFTAEPHESRSTRYCTDGMRGFGMPILHVNGDDPQAVVFCARLAFAFRQRFKRDIALDIMCYRRWGHNEADEPFGTNPLLYQKIKAHPTVLKLYSEQLLANKVVTSEDLVARQKGLQALMKQGSVLQETQSRHMMGQALAKHHRWHPYIEGDWRTEVSTGFAKERLLVLAKQIKALADKVSLQTQVASVMQAFAKMTSGSQPVYWGFAETMAYATLLDQGYSVRLVGQDSGRGTFAHRHALLHDYDTGQVTIPLQHLGYKKGHGQCQIYNSVLSEQACLGFEYGYAISDPRSLVIWEAQFGDFANGGQIMIDQFISSGWQKWQRLCGLVLLLPHGQEGMGPEHSSARLERFLQLSAQHNLQVCIPTTPAQMFHLLRRQMLRPFRKPLVIFTPKSWLRLEAATSSLEDLAKGSFQLVIPEPTKIVAKQCKRIVLCSGKVYYDLLARRHERDLKDIPLIRLEQLYPFPEEELKRVISYYGHVKQVIWCQEEPRNQGVWYIKRHCIERCLGANQRLEYVGRHSFAAPACGYAKLHKTQQSLLVDQALGLAKIEQEEGE